MSGSVFLYSLLCALIQALLFSEALPLPCTSSMDCQLNGECSSTTQKCVCDKGWTGDYCGDLDIAGTGTVAYGIGSPLTPNTSAWGGGPPVLGTDNKYHLLVTEIAGNYLTVYINNSFEQDMTACCHWFFCSKYSLLFNLSMNFVYHTVKTRSLWYGFLGLLIDICACYC